VLRPNDVPENGGGFGRGAGSKMGGREKGNRSFSN